MYKIYTLLLVFLLAGCATQAPEVRGLENTKEFNINTPEKMKLITESSKENENE